MVLFRTVHRKEGQLACLLPLTPDLSPLTLFPQMLSCLEHMYHDLGLVRDFNINPITLRRWLVSDEPTLRPVTSPATPAWSTILFWWQWASAERASGPGELCQVVCPICPPMPSEE